MEESLNLFTEVSCCNDERIMLMFHLS